MSNQFLNREVEVMACSHCVNADVSHLEPPCEDCAQLVDGRVVYNNFKPSSTLTQPPVHAFGK